MLILRLLVLVAAPLVARAQDSAPAKVTSIFIDTVSGYDELSTCAEEVLSTIVRAQYSGCGDQGAVTSYTCFCTASSSLMSVMITQAVSRRCDSSIVSDQASSAIDVFDAYCAIGVPGDLATATTAASSAGRTASASPASTASTTAASATAVDSGSASSTPTSASSPSSSMSRSKVVAIAVGVSVPCGILAISLIACLIWCRRRRRHEQLRSEKRQQLESTSQAAGVGSSRPEFRWPARIAGTTQELPTQYHSHEMPTKEPIVSPPSSSDYHISPLPVAPAQQKQPVYQVQSDKIPYQHQEFYQPAKKAQHQQQGPQELPTGIEDRHELEGSPSPLSPTGRFSYQTYEK